jgi:hypothetical protein
VAFRGLSEAHEVFMDCVLIEVLSFLLLDGDCILGTVA